MTALATALLEDCPPTRGGSSARPERRVLMVDQDRRFLGSLAELLQAEGYETTIHTTPETALSDARRRRPELLLLGLHLPRLDGLELMRRLRDEAHVPAILMTRSDDDFGEVMALRAGADDVVRRPIGVVVLLERIKAVARRPAPADQTGTRDPDEVQVGDLYMSNPA
jgi:DNA-binding response OmpR family regulator